MLGQDDITTTQGYLQTTNERKEQAIEKFTQTIYNKDKIIVYCITFGKIKL